MNVNAQFSDNADLADWAARRVGIGHNGGPPLDEPGRPWGSGGAYAYMCWHKAQLKAWRDVPLEIVRMRAARAAKLGLTYREYTLEILERGRYLSESDVDRIEKIIANRSRIGP